jgi:GNAT superfamily N-acetyltransferase
LISGAGINMKGNDAIAYRDEVREGDVRTIKGLAESSGYFNDEEVRVATELIEERLSKGLASGYRFLFAESGGEVAAYTCYGHISGTRYSYDLYWIVVLDSERGKKLGSRLLAETEARIAALGGKRVYVETSSREQYVPTRSFYHENDSKVIYVKVLG